MRTRVARIGKPHGLRGEVTAQVFTDVPAERFVAGATFEAEGGPRAALTLAGARRQGSGWLLAFEEVAGRDGAETLRGTVLFADVDADEEDDGWYEEDLVGLGVFDPAGERIGTVSGLQVRPAQDLLEIALATGHVALVPFVEAIVPEVDPEAGRLVLDAPEGLLELGRDES
ncbi:ribosome maturation factor RimM [Agilicoccus flavus]|uniref:ribosome maturation factor RimM n=1 Tax=Agilicoccus flavus TaxID=2775968 RepID=UPI001CF675AE|nr:ribosome maturation factor RimM [Agilicoccus flavus]